MNPEELRALAVCVICRRPVRRAVEVIDHSTGDDGLACKACLRRYRQTTDTSPK